MIKNILRDRVRIKIFNLCENSRQRLLESIHRRYMRYNSGRRIMKDVYKIKIRKRLENMNNPCQCSMVVPQLAKRHILDFIDKEIDRRHCELIQVGTDSLDMTLLEKSLNPPSGS